MSVKRYDLVTIYRSHESWDEMVDAEDGTYVRHDDYAELESKLETALRECRSAGITIDNLEAKCATLAAENAWMKEYLVVEVTPATDDFLSEVRAQGVEMFAQKCNSKSEQSFASDIRDNWKLLGEHAADFAAQLRKGDNQ